MTPETIAELFAASENRFRELPVSEESGERLRRDLGALDRNATETIGLGELLVGLYHALDLPLADVLKSAWSSLVELQDYLDPAKHPPGESSHVRVGKHTVKSKHQPHLDVVLNSAKIGTIPFDVTFSLDITGSTFLVRAGRIWQATGSEFEGEAKIAYKGLQLVKKKIGLFRSSDAIEFENGIAIPKLPGAAA